MATPIPDRIPDTVDESLTAILVNLEGVLKDKAPNVLSTLRPGKSITELSKLQVDYGFELNDELSSLYLWHDGQFDDSTTDFIPGHSFPSIETVVENRNAARDQLRQATLLQRGFYWLMCGHRKNWMSILEDGAGDGYFFDPKRSSRHGQVFYCFQETGDYTFFPSLRNLLKAITECYAEGIFRSATNSESFEDFERSARIMEKYGTSLVR